jgi:hypothetical protein
VPEGLAVPVLSVGLQPERELAAEVSPLRFSTGTMGLEVVWWQKVDPVGLTPGGNFDL